MDKAFKQDSKVLRKRGEDERLSVEAMKDRAEWSMAVLRWAMAQGNKDAVDHFQGESVVKYFEKDLMVFKTITKIMILPLLGKKI